MSAVSSRYGNSSNGLFRHGAAIELAERCSPFQPYWSSAAEAKLSVYSHLAESSEDAAARAKGQYDVDQELAALEKVMASFRERRNALSPLARLPDEITVYIFCLHAENQPPASDNFIWNEDEDDVPSLSQVQLGWITVTHVCTAWRRIALSHPNLWTNIVFGLGERWVREMLIRAKSAPIVYRRKDIVGAAAPPDNDLLSLKQNIHHIRTLNLSGDDTGISRALGALTTAAPLLETLSLQASTGASLPNDIFNYESPSLRKMSISGMRLHWDTFAFRDLHSLEIHMIPAWRLLAGVNGPQVSDMGPSHDRLLSIIAQMPELEYLSLLNCLPLHSAYLPDDHAVVDLPHLQQLHLSGSGLQCLNVLQSLAIPDSCSLSIGASRLDGEIDIFDSLLSYAAAHIRRQSELNPIETLSVDTTTLEPKLSICGYRSSNELNGSPLYPPHNSANLTPPAIHLRLWWHFTQPNQAELFRDLVRKVFSIFEFRALRELSLPLVDSGWTRTDWRTVVGPLTTLEHVRAKGRGAVTLACTLLDRVPDSRHPDPPFADKPDSVPLFLPRLTNLKFDSVNFRAWPDPEDSEDVFHELLPQVLKQRRIFGAGIRALALEECNVRPAWVARLREAVPRVEWDNYDYWDELEGF